MINIKYKIEDIENYFLSKSDKISLRKLQSLLYFAYSWYLAIMNEDKDKINIKLFDGEFGAGIHGAICEELQDRYKGVIDTNKYEGKLVEFDEDTLDILEQVWDVYGCYSGLGLDSICRQHNPWKITKKKLNIISDDLLFDYYSKKLEYEDS